MEIIPRGKTREDKPDERDITSEVVTHYAIKWREVGLALGVTSSQLDVINVDHPRSCEERFKVMLRIWLHQDPSATWGKLVDAINSPTVSSISAGVSIQPMMMPVASNDQQNEHLVQSTDIISVEKFAETGNVGTAFIILQTKLSSLLEKVNLSSIKRACIVQQYTPGGVQLPEQLREKIFSARNIDELLDVLVESPYWNWIDLRLLQAIVEASDLPSTLQLLKNYKMAIFTRKLIDVLPNFPSKAVKEEYFCKLVSKLDKEPDTVTVADLLEFQSQMERVIMDIAAGVCVLGHLDRGCIEVHWYIPTHYVKSVHQSAFARCYLFIKMHLLWMQVGYYPKIHNPLTSPKIVIPALQTLNSAAEMTNLINYRHDGIHVNIIPVVKKLYIQLLHEEMAVTVPINDNHNGSPVDYHSQVVDVKWLVLFYEVIKTCGSYKTNGELLLNDKCSPKFCALVKSNRSLALW